MPDMRRFFSADFVRRHWGTPEEKKLIFLDDDISPERIIKQSDLVISPVYSTPSLIAKLLNIPSYYYDPKNQVDESLVFNRDIPIIYGKNIKGAILKIYNEWKK